MLTLRTAMLAEHVPSLPVGPEWEYEILWPGERVLAAKDGAGVRLTSVSHRRDVTNRFPVIAAMIAKLGPVKVVLDGVVGPVDANTLGADALTAGPAGVGRIAFIAYDVLWIDELDLRPWGRGERRQRLQELINGTGLVPATPSQTSPNELLADARRLGAEAVLAKRTESKYRPFARNGDWVRVTVQPAEAPAPQRRRAHGSDRERRGTTPPFGLGQMA